MKRLSPLFILLSLLAAGAASATPEADSCNAFGLRLKTHLSGPAENLVFSPFSIYTALALTHAGAAGRTAEQMAATLGLTPKLDLCSFQKSLSSAADTTRATFQRSANGVWLATEPHPDFIAEARSCFGAEVGGLSREKINARISELTAGRIGDLLPEGSVDDLTRVILTNAIYFKGKWEHPFAEGATVPRDFHLQDGTSLKIPTMTQFSVLSHYRSPGLGILRLPYRDSSFEMIVLLPDQPDELPELEANLTVDSLNAWIARTETLPVEVYLPRFSLDFREDIAGALPALGIVDALGRSADFSRMAVSHEALFIGKVLHATVLDADENGTEAAAATAVEMRRGGIGPRLLAGERPVVFRANHPFLFAIRDSNSGTLLFLGRVARPEARKS